MPRGPLVRGGDSELLKSLRHVGGWGENGLSHFFQPGAAFTAAPRTTEPPTRAHRIFTVSRQPRNNRGKFIE